MHGPIAAEILLSFAPFSSISFIVFSITPVNAPFHPACAAPITPFILSPKRIGAQSAVRIAIAISLLLVTKASSLGPSFLKGVSINPAIFE